MNGNEPGPALVVEGLEKSYREWPVLWNLDLNLAWGETLALFGSNGSGKTTLLRILSTSIRPDAGTARIAGLDLATEKAEIRQRVGVVGHRGFLYDDLTPRENLIYYARLFGLDDRDNRVAEVLDRVGLSSRGRHRLRTLSNGMQKRVSIARAILHRPELLLLDEPEAGLDRDSREMLGQLLEEWTAEGRSAIFTTHEIELGLSWAHQAAVLSGGRLTFPGSRAVEIQQLLAPTADREEPR